VVGPADVAALAVHIMTNAALTGHLRHRRAANNSSPEHDLGRIPADIEQAYRVTT